MRPNSEAWSEAESQALIELVSEGWATCDIAKQLERTEGAVRQKGYYFGLKFPKKKRRAPKPGSLSWDKVEQVRSLYKLGMPIKDIREQVCPEVTHNCVYLIVTNRRRV